MQVKKTLDVKRIDVELALNAKERTLNVSIDALNALISHTSTNQGGRILSIFAWALSGEFIKLI